MEQKPCHKFIVAQDAKPLTLEMISQMFFGLPFNEAVHSVCDNKNGKYDRFYTEPKKGPEQK